MDFEGHDMAAHKNSSGGILSSIKSFLDRNRLGELLVIKGKITPTELRSLLVRQRSENRPLGEILVAENVISRAELRFALATQSSLRIIAATFAIAGGLITMSGKSAWAAGIKDIPAKITLASSAAFGGLSGYPSLFGADEKRSGDLSAFTKWSGMFSRFDDDANAPAAQAAMAKWKNDLSKFQGKDLETMARGVNDLMNRVEYINDSRNWGKSDYWATPVEFMRRGGDCEDFAIAKYSSLRALGVPEERMRIAIVKDMEKGIPHAVLVVYADSGALVLDNQIKSVRTASSIQHYKPIFSINRTSWWLHSTPSGRGANTVIAAAE